MLVLDWIPAIPATLTALAIVLVPGATVVFAGWGFSLRMLLVAPPISLAIVAGSAILADWFGIAWGILPVALGTAVGAVAVFGLRAGIGHGPRAASPRATLIAAAAGLLIGSGILVRRLMTALVSPTSFSNNFDNVFHLNAVAFAVETRDASASHIATLVDIPFYPNGFNSLASLTALTAGVEPTVAVNAITIALVAVVWPLGCMALAWHLFRGRPVSVFLAGVLAAAFGAFPFVPLWWGPLYPNLTGMVMIPAALTLALETLRAEDRPRRTLLGALAFIAACGTFIGHPNAFVSLVTFTALYAVIELVLRGRRLGTRSGWIQAAVGSAGIAAAVTAMLLVFRTNYEWDPWQSPSQALGQALTGTPGSGAVSLAMAVLLAVAVVTYARNPKRLRSAVPFIIAAGLFVINSGLPTSDRLRDFLADPYYNDSWRLAALVGLAAVPVAVLGATVVWDALVALLNRFAPRWRGVRWAAGTVAALTVIVLMFAATGPAADEMVNRVKEFFTTKQDDMWMSQAEYDLVMRMPETTPEDALIFGEPQAGASWAYALAHRDVVLPHIFGDRTADEKYLARHLDEIETDPQVCQAVVAVGVTHVLDFGPGWKPSPDARSDYPGLEHLHEGDHLRLIDEEGANARLYEIVGC